MSQDRDRRYWQSIEKPAPIEEDPGVARRDFLRFAGFALGATALAGCSRGPSHGVMPYLVRPEEVTPGKPYWYASVCGACSAGCGILSKNRDGRPIKLEGSPQHPLSRGGLCAAGQASVLELYDSKRLRHPAREGQEMTWTAVDEEISRALESIRASGGRVRFLTDSVTGPSEEESIAAFLERFGDGRHVTYDPISVSAIADAYRDTLGARVVPRYRFDRAEVIVSLGADFLGTWFSPVEHTAGYRAGRSLDDAGRVFSHHVQIESRLSLTGSNADRRYAVPPGALSAVLAHLTAEVGRLKGSTVPLPSLPTAPLGSDEIAEIVGRLVAAPRGKTLVVCGENDVEAQRLTSAINHLLGNHGTGADGTTVDLESVSSQRRGDDAELAALIEELETGRVDALFLRGGNPVYDLPSGERLAETLDRLGLVVSFSGHENETARHARFICPEPHFLESWGDAEPVAGLGSVRQPAIRPIGSTRPLLESLAAWSGSPATAYEIVRDGWRRRVYPRREEDASFDDFWNRALHDGSVRLRTDAKRRIPDPGAFDFSSLAASAPRSEPAADDLVLDLHASAGVLDGRHALNPWLQEMPDPIAKTVWDNHASLAPALAERMGIATGDVVRIAPAAGEPASIEIPAVVQPGQDDRTVAIALGYGRAGTERFSKIGPLWWEGRPTVEENRRVGVNAAPLLAWSDSRLTYSGRPVRLEKTGRRHTIASTQSHGSLIDPIGPSAASGEPRPIVQEMTLAAWKDDPAAGGHGHHVLHSLWPDHPKKPHHWGMAIDLTACTGCSACVVSCQAENNIPVVGKDEVHRSREMHWMRIDRYYSGEGSNVDVVHMPMLCQHCDNAPCETVCPVLATAQSAEGLNQQIYNRCVGTRYCANNCPYKVRRFNWFEYSREDRLQNLALNPDVTVRSRGVMEKCSLCVQRIQDGKAEAKRAGRPVRDGDIMPACAQSCPASAIVFGDMNDPESRLRKLKDDPRHYVVLAELGVKPVVGYMTLVRNRDEHGKEKGTKHHG